MLLLRFLRVSMTPPARRRYVCATRVAMAPPQTCHVSSPPAVLLPLLQNVENATEQRKTLAVKDVKPI
jgi:hypothetical protein